MSATLPTFQEFCKENFNIHSFKIIFFHVKTQFLMIRNLSQYKNVLVQVVILATLSNLVVISKLRLWNISKRIASLIFLNISLHHKML